MRAWPGDTSSLEIERGPLGITHTQQRSVCVGGSPARLGHLSAALWPGSFARSTDSRLSVWQRMQMWRLARSFGVVTICCQSGPCTAEPDLSRTRGRYHDAIDVKADVTSLDISPFLGSRSFLWSGTTPGLVIPPCFQSLLQPEYPRGPS